MFVIRRTTLMEIAAVAAPVFVVGATRVVMSPTVEAASAAPTQTVAIVPVDTSVAPPTPEQLRAAEWARGIDLKQQMPSPLDHPRPAAPVIVAPPPDHPPDTPPTNHYQPPLNLPLSQFNLTATMGNANMAIAAINGRVYRVGDELAPGYEVVAIDTKANEVDVRMPDGSLGRLKRQN